MDEDLAADPEQPAEIDAGGRRRGDVEHVEHVDEGHDLVPRRRRGEHLQQHARAARRSRAHDLRQLAARKPARQRRV